MIKVNDEVKQLARTLADWAADKSVTVFLFGSRVRGDHRPDSDVDV
jgi:predicted nucleotidyltransferase